MIGIGGGLGGSENEGKEGNGAHRCNCNCTLRGWTEPKPKLYARTEIPAFGLGLQEIPAYRLQLTGRKEENYISSGFVSESESEIDAQERSLPAFFLTVVAGMPVFLAVLSRKQEFRFLHKVSVSVLFIPYGWVFLLSSWQLWPVCRYFLQS